MLSGYLPEVGGRLGTVQCRGCSLGNMPQVQILMSGVPMTIHLATSMDIGKVVRRALRLAVHFVPDNLLVGPCGSDPGTHIKQRCEFWGLEGRERTQFRSAFDKLIGALKSRRRIVVWTSGLWSDRLALWALCAWWLAFRDQNSDLLEVVVVGDAPKDGFSRGFVRMTPGDARRALDNARAQSLTRTQQMARYWRKVSGRYPILSAVGARAGRTRKDLAELGAYQAGYFPRMGECAIQLSRFDELLFSCLDKDWRTPADVFVHRSSAGEELRAKWMTRTGDIFLALRLQKWAEHRGADAALECVPHRPDRSMLEARYRLSKAGDAIKEHGLAEIAQGAPLAVWGVLAYNATEPWVVVNNGGEYLAEAFLRP